jgi:hypothetical protein
MLDLVLRPGDDINDSARKGTLARIDVHSSVLYGQDYESTADEGGRVTLPYLIPGAPYLIRAQEPIGWPVKTTFTAPQTGVLELGDVVIDPRPTPGPPQSP